jgi:hypothetical protein
MNARTNGTFPKAVLTALEYGFEQAATPGFSYRITSWKDIEKNMVLVEYTRTNNNGKRTEYREVFGPVYDNHGNVYIDAGGFYRPVYAYGTAGILRWKREGNTVCTGPHYVLEIPPANVVRISPITWIAHVSPDIFASKGSFYVKPRDKENLWKDTNSRHAGNTWLYYRMDMTQKGE